MQIEKISFDRVFDVQEISGSFSFERGGWPVYGVSVPGMGIPQAGATYAVAFAEAGNWQTVLGWRDLATPDVRLRQTAWQFAIAQLPYAYLLTVIVGIAATLGGYWAALPLAALMLLVLATAVRRVAWRNRWVSRALQVGRSALGPRWPSGWRAGLMWALAPLVFWH